MLREKQVDRSHYEFHYVNKLRWMSFWHQLAEVLKRGPKRVLEVGPGPGVFKSVAAAYGVHVETVDIAGDLHPDHIASATSLPFQDSSYDLVCSFQMLEHLPYDESLKAFGEMVRVSRRHVVISLPDARTLWRYTGWVPKMGVLEFFIQKPFWRSLPHVFDGEHYWEINKQGYPLDKVIRDLSGTARLVETYRVNENPYHRFMVFERR